MRNTLVNLFGRSPFSPLQAHMDKVSACVEKVSDIFDALQKEDYEKIEKISSKISKLEHEADLTKNDIRNNLPKGLFLPIDRGNILVILSLQDDIADKAEDIGILLTLSKLKMLDVFKEDFNEFLSINLKSFEGARCIIEQLDELIQFSFGGTEATKVNRLVDNVAFNEHKADLAQRQLLKNLFANESELTIGSFHLWLRIFNGVASLSNLSEKLANRIRMTLDLK